MERLICFTTEPGLKHFNTHVQSLSLIISDKNVQSFSFDLVLLAFTTLKT